jgi:hypothetical protein
MNRRPDPLTPEERELADRLARIAPARLPSGDLDARILRAGRDAAAATRRHPPARRRWPAVVGLAATLALAIGAAWQLRPMAEAPVAMGEAPVATADSATGEAAAAARAPGTADVLQPAPAEPAPAASPARPVASPMAAPAAPGDGVPRPAANRPTPRNAEAATASPAAPATPAAPPPPPVLPAPPPPPEPLAASAPPPPPAPPAPPAPPVGEAGASSAADARQAAQAAASRASRERAAAMQRSSPAGAMQARSLSAPATQDQPPPPTTLTVADLAVASDAGLAPAVWIERIRQRRDGGDLAGARASLQQLRAAHPDVALPDDLRELAATAPGQP